MKRIFIPTQAPSDWQRLLAKPALHWRKSYSAMTTAACWEAACDCLPAEVKQTLDASGRSDLVGLKLLAAIPEWQVALPGGKHSSHTDVLALASNDEGLVVLAVEAKVDEPFGPTLGEKRDDESTGQSERIDYLHTALRLETPLRDEIRYQLLHRTVSALQTALDFHARSAVMLVHSFSPTRRWREDFLSFCEAITATPLSPDLYVVSRFESPRLYLAWCTGDKSFLDVDLPREI
ncbi:MAG TPA: hypothetical protein VMW16_10560 [Sedimentisphaerales bacterium]|nr:hypothetical protein [Sedimentisphaerales bacterium]